MSNILQTSNESSATGGSYGVRLLLDAVGKTYRGQAAPAVNGLTLEIPAGKMVALVGPSGCGKTTTLKMINRLIEPTSGRIMIGDEDVTDIDGDQLRRRIGYVIQAGGLFPHMTVEANIAMVPKMLGWDKARISQRVEELLELVSLDPALYRGRYPKQLSGGQQQRVGVARALAADPPVLLMDEPFGAVDPITRQRLQDELLHIQEDVQKTIVFVTHDFDEAVKLGDYIAIFSEGAHLVQYDTPERILADPANEFVEDFIGAGAGLKQLTLTRVGEVTLGEVTTGHPGERSADVLARLEGAGHDNVVIVDERERPLQWLSRRQLKRIDVIGTQKNENLPTVGLKATLHDALDSMLESDVGAAIVVGSRQNLIGIVDVSVVTDAISAARNAATQAPAEDAPLGTNTDTFDIVQAATEDSDAEPIGDGGR
ncbi:betaine/proline/choline family ABC transporter ATP-binding protein [Salinibacterium sp. NK8237]|uniref:betaine/proline/choline family ABC transporter ATP-binding protein n=1 Tax=Salinibacterium sp. NK8237 TaxID=2792038 RepID=UPI0035A8D082